MWHLGTSSSSTNVYEGPAAGRVAARSHTSPVRPLQSLQVKGLSTGRSKRLHLGAGTVCDYSLKYGALHL